MLVSNLQSEFLGEEMIKEEYELMSKAKHLITLKMDYDEWKQYRLTEHHKEK